MIACVAAIMLGVGACTGPQTTGADPEPSKAAPDLPEWEAVSGLDIPRDDFATAVIGDQIWNFGGMSGDRGSRLDTIEIYNTRTDNWRLYDKVMPESLASFEAAAIGDKVFLFGGLDRNTEASDFSAVLDTSSGKWRQLPPLPAPRYSHTVTLHDGLIYVIGGEGAQGPVDAVDIFDPGTGEWSTASTGP